MRPSKIYRLRKKADEDLQQIYVYSLEHWGSERAEKYIHSLATAFQDLALNPGMGRICNPVKPGLYAFNVVSHVIFYLPTAYGISVIRVLHKSMDYPQHL